mmetsp:Transcript_28920/g.81446  ORF Transcript_28920/g.81446 Transcript_28920/m.81446 type:complete len:311 (+) Transcript_28920:523-1455(+)
MVMGLGFTWGRTPAATDRKRMASKIEEDRTGSVSRGMSAGTSLLPNTSSSSFWTSRWASGWAAMRRSSQPTVKELVSAPAPTISFKQHRSCLSVRPFSCWLRIILSSTSFLVGPCWATSARRSASRWDKILSRCSTPLRSVFIRRVGSRCMNGTKSWIDPAPISVKRVERTPFSSAIAGLLCLFPNSSRSLISWRRTIFRAMILRYWLMGSMSPGLPPSLDRMAALAACTSPCIVGRCFMNWDLCSISMLKALRIFRHSWPSLKAMPEPWPEVRFTLGNSGLLAVSEPFETRASFTASGLLRITVRRWPK